MTQEHLIRFRAESNVAQELKKAERLVRAIRRTMMSGSKRQMVSADNVKVLDAIAQHLVKLTSSTEMAITSQRKFRGEFEKFENNLESTSSEIRRIDAAFDEHFSSLSNKYAEAIIKSEQYQNALHEEMKAIHLARGGDPDVFGSPVHMGEEGGEVWAGLKSQAAQKLAPTVQKGAGAMAMHGPMEGIEDFGMMGDQSRWNAFTKNVEKAKKQLLDYETGGITPTVSSLTSLEQRFDALIQTAKEWKDGIQMTTESQELMDVEFKQFTQTLDKQRKKLGELNASYKQAQVTQQENTRAERETKREAERTATSIKNNKTRTIDHLNRSIQNNITMAEGMDVAWKDLGVNAGLSTRRVMELSYQLKAMAKNELVVAGSSKFTTDQILKQAAAMDQLTGKVAQVNNRMAFMQDANVGVQNTMRWMSSGMQGAMTAMSIMNGDVMGLAFSLIFMQFSGALKASLAFGVLTLAIMGAWKVFSKWKTSRKEVEKQERAWATLTGAMGGYEQAQRRAEDYIAGVTLAGKEEEEAIKALTQAQLHLRKARKESTPENMKVMLMGWLAARGYGMEYEEALQAALSTTMDFASDSGIALDGVVHTMESLEQAANNYINYMIQKKPSMFSDQDVITAADLVSLYEKMNIEIPKILDSIATADPTRTLRELVSLDDLDPNTILQPLTDAFGVTPVEGMGMQLLRAFIDGYPSMIQDKAPTVTTAWKKFAEEGVKAASPTETAIAELKGEVNKVTTAWGEGTVDTLTELRTFEQELGTIMASITAHMGISGSSAGLEELAKNIKDLDTELKPVLKKQEFLNTYKDSKSWQDYGSMSENTGWMDFEVLSPMGHSSPSITVSIGEVTTTDARDFTQQLATALKTNNVLRLYGFG